MSRLLAICAALCVLTVATLSAAATIDDIISAHQAGDSEADLLKLIKDEGLDSRVSAENMNALLTAGVGTRVINAVLAAEARLPQTPAKPKTEHAGSRVAGSAGLTVVEDDAGEDDAGEDDGGGSSMVSWKDDQGNVHYTNDPSLIPAKYRQGGASTNGSARGRTNPSGGGDTCTTGIAGGTRSSGPYVMTTRVKEVVDSNTIRLGTGEVIRLIGCSKEAGPAARGALDYLKMTVANQPVSVLFDVRKRDPVDGGGEGMLAGYVFFQQMTFINAELIRQGQVRHESDKVNHEYTALFTRLEGVAKQNKRGLWRQ